MENTTAVENVKTGYTGYLYGLFASDQPAFLWECRYVGETTQALRDRLRVHNGDARRGMKSKRCNWIKSVIARGAIVEMRVFETHQAPDKKSLKAKLHEREIIWIAEGRRQGWRLTNGTDGGDGVVGLVVSEENRRKTSERAKGNKYGVGGTGPLGYKWSDDMKARQSAAKKGKPLNLSDEVRATKSEQMKGNTLGAGYDPTPEVRAATSERMLGNQYALGVRHTEEQKALWSAQRTGVPKSPESIAKTVAANIGKKRTPEQIERNRQAQTGKRQSQETKDKKNAQMRGQTRSAETRERMSAAQKLSWAKRREEKEQAANDD